MLKHVTVSCSSHVSHVKCLNLKILWGRGEGHMGWVGGWVGHMSKLVGRGG